MKAAFIKMKELADRIAEGRELIRQAREAQRACSEYSDEAAKMRKDLERETGGMCPACGRPSP